MTCRETRESLKAHADGELGLRSRMAVRAHLLHCPACRAEMQAIRSASQPLSLLGAPAPPARLRAAVLDAATALPQPSVKARAGRRPRWLLPAFSAAIVLALAAWLLLPATTDAQAAFERVTAAVDGVQTFHMVRWSQMPGQERTTSQTWYADGKWRMEESTGEVQVFDGQRLHIYSPWQNAALLNVSEQPFGTPFTGFKAEALLGGTAPDVDIVLRTERYEGRPAHRFERTHQGLGERLVIHADRDTGLPLAVEVYGRSALGWQLLSGTDTIEYDMPLDSNLFLLSPPLDAVVVDKEEWGQAWLRRYEQGMSRSASPEGEVVLRDFQVTSGGDVYAICTGTPDPITWHLPDGSQLQSLDAELSDSLQTVYLRKSCSGSAPKGMGAWFIPLVPPASQPSWYHLNLLARERDRDDVRTTTAAEFHVTDPILSPLSDPIYPPLESAPQLPMFGQSSDWHAEAARAEVRAEYWRDHRDPQRALEYYEQILALTRTHAGLFRLGSSQWLDIGSTYEQAGKPDKAREAYEQGLSEAEAQGQYWEREVIEQLRAAIDRLP